MKWPIVKNTVEMLRAYSVLLKQPGSSSANNQEIKSAAPFVWALSLWPFVSALSGMVVDGPKIARNMNRIKYVKHGVCPELMIVPVVLVHSLSGLSVITPGGPL